MRRIGRYIDCLSKEEGIWGDNAVAGHPADGNFGKNAKQNHPALRQYRILFDSIYCFSIYLYYDSYIKVQIDSGLC